MTACLLFIEILRENKDKSLRRERVFRDRSQVLDMLTDIENSSDDIGFRGE